MLLPVADQRILRGVTSTLSWQNLGGDGEAAAPAGAVTIGVVRDDGTVLVAPGTATGGEGSDPRTYTLAAADNGVLDFLTATWTDSDGSSHTTYVEVVGGFYFTIEEARASDPALSSDTKFTTPEITAARREVEEEFELICDLAFVPRYRRQVLTGDDCGAIVLDRQYPRVIRSVRDYTDATTYTAWDADDLATLVIDDWGQITSRTGVTFRSGTRNLVIGYEHGLNAPPVEVKRAALQRLRSRVNMAKSGIPDRATSFSVAEGGTYRLAQADAYRTGLPDVDAVLARWSRRIPGIA